MKSLDEIKKENKKADVEPDKVIQIGDIKIRKTSEHVIEIEYKGRKAGFTQATLETIVEKNTRDFKLNDKILMWLLNEF